MQELQDFKVRATPRLIGLDLIRLLAVLLVLGRHMDTPPEELSNIWRFIFLTWARGGWVGVDVFFVLSGFLVSGLLFAEYRSRGRFSIGRFYTRRGWKIYPPFFVLITVTVMLFLATGRPVAKSGLLSEIVFLQSYVPGLWNHTWSLAVEEHFYILLPLILVLSLRFGEGSAAPLKPVVALAAGVAVCVFLLRLINWYYRITYDHYTHLFATHLRFDSLFFGVTISCGYNFYKKQFIKTLEPWKWQLVICGALLLSPAFVYPIETTPFIFTAGLTLFYLGLFSQPSG